MSKTSTAVKQRYLDKTYSQISVRLPKELVSEFKRTCEAEGISVAGVIRTAVENFLEQKKR